MNLIETALSNDNTGQEYKIGRILYLRVDNEDKLSFRQPFFAEMENEESIIFTPSGYTQYSIDNQESRQDTYEKLRGENKVEHYKITLTQEQDNKHDTNATIIYASKEDTTDPIDVGYVPKPFNEILLPHLHKVETASILHWIEFMDNKFLAPVIKISMEEIVSYLPKNRFISLMMENEYD